jgi:hypothetical protein
MTIRFTWLTWTPAFTACVTTETPRVETAVRRWVGRKRKGDKNVLGVLHHFEGLSLHGVDRVRQYGSLLDVEVEVGDARCVDEVTDGGCERGRIAAFALDVLSVGAPEGRFHMTTGRDERFDVGQRIGNRLIGTAVSARKDERQRDFVQSRFLLEIHETRKSSSRGANFVVRRIVDSARGLDARLRPHRPSVDLAHDKAESTSLSPDRAREQVKRQRKFPRH